MNQRFFVVIDREILSSSSPTPNSTLNSAAAAAANAFVAATYFGQLESLI